MKNMKMRPSLASMRRIGAHTGVFNSHFCTTCGYGGDVFLAGRKKKAGILTSLEVCYINARIFEVSRLNFPEWLDVPNI